MKFAENVNNKFISRICLDNNNKIIFYGINKTINMSELVGVCVYRKILDTKEKRIVILLIAIHPNVRNCGYGNIFMKELLDYLKNDKILEVILHSLSDSTNFYLKFGFKYTNQNKFISNYEGIEYDKNIKILSLLT